MSRSSGVYVRNGTRTLRLKLGVWIGGLHASCVGNQFCALALILVFDSMYQYLMDIQETWHRHDDPVWSYMPR